MIPEYKRDRQKPFDFEQLQEEMPQIADLIIAQNTWAQYEQAPDFTDIPLEYQKMLPDNIRNQKEDLRTYNIWLTKQ